MALLPTDATPDAKLENPDEYIEQEARDQNMVKPGEIVMQEVPGK